ncbi:response regulator transcription factor [Aestuariibacter sp. A3R04]|uniref:response regulator transcription factor n=1 Tax=Aestuariibacter sp. A3R04 TaxID=2841571 RepID=UPI001C0827DF|nr:response regulator transcription factor [Aestuariibacter sp. A3R04]MBU3021365.1 response regulator transcription factor [Aestuariibacter sp. A3R04]
MNILLVDDHAVVREGYKALLNAMMPDCEVFDADNGARTQKILANHDIDILILDINLANESGLVLAKFFLQQHAQLKIIFFSMFEDSVILQRAMQTGAMGYISKSSSPEILISAIKVVARGQKYIERTLAVNLANQLLDANVDLATKLTKREFEIFIAIAMNKSRFDIADELGLSAKTISNALTVIKRKLNAVPSEFCTIAARHGYIGGADPTTVNTISCGYKTGK